jgi:YfiH family protein
MDMIIPNWPAPSNVKAFASTRAGGFSIGPYQGLNLGAHVGDDIHVVEKNRQWLFEHSAMPSHPVWLNQTHSTLITQVDKPSDKVLDCDGVFTQSHGVVCSAMTADCLPILLTNLSGTQIAAVHAGWRGLANGIVENALAKFSNVSDVMAWIGPAIGANAFEVGKDVLDAFSKFDEQAGQAFVAQGTPDKWLADMNILVTQRLNKAGVEQVYYSDLCTFSDDKRFYSYRRDGMTGRQASFIWLES